MGEKYIKIFTMLPPEQIEEIAEKHKQEPHLRNLQKVLAREITIMVHSEEEYNAAVDASEILFGKGTAESLAKLKEADFLAIFEGVPQFSLSKDELVAGIQVIDLLAEKSDIFPSKGEARRNIAGCGVSINKVKLESADMLVDSNQLIGGKYLLVQKGKKNYYLILAV